MKIINVFIFFIVAFCISFSPEYTYPQQSDLCCERVGLFTSIEMPPEQEYDVTGFIHGAWYGALRDFDIINCSLCSVEWAEYSYSGRKILQWMVDEIGKVSGVETDPEVQKQFKEFLDADYVWKASLKLNHIDEIIEGEWEDNPQHVKGDWTLNIQLLNVHFGEIVEEGSVSWSGTAFGRGLDRVKDLARTKFSPVNKKVYDYEHIPRNCEIILEDDKVDAGQEMIITLKLTDEKNQKPKPWQRVVVKVDRGDIVNGTLCSDEEKLYAFEVGDGDLKVKYRAPLDCNKKDDKITVYNSCDWGRKDVRPLSVTNNEKELKTKKIEIDCPEGKFVMICNKVKSLRRKTVSKDRDGTVNDDRLRTEIEKLNVGQTWDLKLTQGMFNPGMGAYVQLFQLENGKVSSFYGNYFFSERATGPDWSYDENIDGGASYNLLKEMSYPQTLMLFWDKDKKKVIDMQLGYIPGFTMDWSLHRKWVQRGPKDHYDEGNEDRTREKELLDCALWKEFGIPKNITGKGRVFRGWEEIDSTSSKILNPEGTEVIKIKNKLEWGIYLNEN